MATDDDFRDFKHEMDERHRDYIRRDVFEQIHQLMLEKLTTLERRLDKLDDANMWITRLVLGLVFTGIIGTYLINK